VALAEVSTRQLEAIDELFLPYDYPWPWCEPDRFGSEGLVLVSRVRWRAAGLATQAAPAG
jgi:hypothetical protein